MKLLVTTQTVDKNDPILGFFIDWLLEFAKHFERVDVICLRTGEYELPSHVHVYSLGKEDGESRIKYVYRFYKFFVYVFFTIRVDYVFYHMGAIYNIMGAPFYLIRKLLKTKFYWWKAHGHINAVGRTALLFVDVVYTASEGSFPIQTKKKKVIGHAIRFNNDIPSTLNAVSLPKIKLISVGRIVRIKNLEIAIDTCQLLLQRGFDPHLDIYGPTEDTEYEKELKMWVSRLHLGDRVQFKGKVSYEILRHEIGRYNVLIHPSGTGSIDKVVIEAIAAGVIPISLNSAYGSLYEKFPMDICVTNNLPEDYASCIENIYTNHGSTEISKASLALMHSVQNEHSIKTLVKRLFEKLS